MFRYASASWIACVFFVASCDEAALVDVGPQIELGRETIDFGAQPIGNSVELSVDVRNVGTLPLTVSLLSIRPAGAPFSIADLSTMVLPHGVQQQVVVRFTPPTDGSFDGELVIVHDADPGPTASVRIVGAGVRADLSVEAIDFGRVTVGETRERLITIDNHSDFPQPLMTRPPTSPFALGEDADASVVVPANGSIAVPVRFTPVDIGDASERLAFDLCDGCELGASLSGEGVKPSFRLTPDALDFGAVQEGDRTRRTVILENTGDVDLFVRGSTFEVGSATGFTVTPLVELPASVPVGETLPIRVDYRAGRPGSDMGRLIVAADAWDDPSTDVDESSARVPLVAQSNGPQLQVSPTSVELGTHPAGGVPIDRVVLLENIGNVALEIRSVDLRSDSAAITLDDVPLLPMVMDPRASVQVRLRYAPTAIGTDTAELVVRSTDRARAVTVVPIRGRSHDGSSCAVTVGPSAVTFGVVERGRSAVREVELRNGGAARCTLTQLRLVGSPEVMLQLAAALPLDVAPGEAHRVAIRYAPTTYGQHAATLELDIDGATPSRRMIPISGASEATDLRVLPSMVDFGVVQAGCRSSERLVRVYNLGATELLVTGARIDQSTTELSVEPLVTPARIPAGDAFELRLRYTPTDVGGDFGRLLIDVERDGVAQVSSVPLTGTAQSDPTITETFEQRAAPRADVLFVVDDSCSMLQEQWRLASNLGAFMSFATQQGVDFRLAVTTTDIARSARGQFVREAPYDVPIIDPSTPDAEAVFTANVTQGTSGSARESGLEAAYLALTDPLTSTHNAGFLREDAALAVIIVSDEDDHSPRSVDFYQQFFGDLKGSTSMLSVSAIVGTEAPSCTGPAGAALHGPRYIDVAEATGGVVASICEANWGQTLFDVGRNSFGLERKFVLSATPEPSSIAVRVDGTAQTGAVAWRYEAATNSIVFGDADIPLPSAIIEVTYALVCQP